MVCVCDVFVVRGVWCVRGVHGIYIGACVCVYGVFVVYVVRVRHACVCGGVCVCVSDVCVYVCVW